MNGEEPDPDRIGTRDDWARAMTALREGAGLTVRDLARQVGAPTATLGDYFAGRHLPGTRQVQLYRSILQACGVTDPPAVDRWLAALTRVRSVSDGRVAKGPAPYRGLDPFTEADSFLFFGRQAVITELLAAVRRAIKDSADWTGSIAVVGPSGSGKTSLFLAGLLPAVRTGAGDVAEARWAPRLVTIDQLEHGLPVEPTDKRQVHSMIVVDQLEAALMLPGDRRAVVLAALDDLQRTSLVIVGLRADFYQAALGEPTLLPALHNQVLVGPMTTAELREAIVGPVREVGAGIEDGLVDLILADLAPGSPPGFAHEPGALPLLSYALLATWNRASRNQLTIADYRAVGGLRGAVRQAAEAVYEDLDDLEREQARRVFTRLVRVDEDGRSSRRRASRVELTSDDESGGGRPFAVLERFVSARLLTADAESVQISHEALLAAWPRLGEWLHSSREWLRVHQQITDAAHTWDESQQDTALLWQGARLEVALDLASGAGRERDLNRVERQFLHDSGANQQERQRVRRRRIRRTQQLLGAVAVLAAVAVVLAAVAVQASRGADRARNQALSRQVAVEAQQLQPTDPSLAAQLALAAYRISPTVQASSTLVDATAGELPTRLLGPIGPEFVATSADGRLLAVAQSADDTVALYRLSSGRADKVAQLRVGPASGNDFAVAVSPNGNLLAAGGTTRTIRLWDIADPARPLRLTTMGRLGGTIYSLSFAPDGLHLAAADSDGTVRQWTIGAGDRPTGEVSLRVAGAEPVKAVAYSPNGAWLAAGGNNGTLDVWKTGDLVPLVAVGTSSADFESVDFNSGGTEFAAGIGNNDAVEIWSITAAGQLRLARAPFIAATSEVTSTVFNPSGGVLAVAAADGTLHLYDTSTWAEVATLGDTDPITSLAFADHGRRLVTADSGGVTRIWSIPPPTADTEPGNVYALDYTANGRYLVACSAGPTGDVTIWDESDPLRPTRLVDLTMPAAFGPAAGAAALTPDGRLLAVANAHAQVQLFDLTDIRHPREIGRPLNGGNPYVEELSFTPNGKLLVEGNDSGQIRIWNVTDAARPHELPTITNGPGEVIGFSFSPSGNLVATASSDKHVRLFDIAHPGHPALLATLGGFSSYAYDTAITPDGHTLIAGSADGSIRLWNITDPSRPQLLGGPLSIPTGYVYALAISPDGRTLAAASTAAAVWLWNIADPSRPQLLDTLTAPHDEVFAVAFSPNGQTLAASGSGNTLYLWDYRATAAAALVCRETGDPITRSEWAQYIQGAGYQPPCG